MDVILSEMECSWFGAKAASREANLERGDGRSRGLAPSPALVQLLNKESSGHRSRADGAIVTS